MIEISKVSNMFSDVGIQTSTASETHYIDLSECDLVDENQNIVETAESVSDALLLSLNNKGKVDIEYISKVSGATKEDVIGELEGAIFLNPSKFDGDIFNGWETRDEYLSGNLFSKLVAASSASKENPGIFETNITAIKSILKDMPKLTADEIYVTLGTPWLTPKIIQSFILDVLKVCSTVRHDDKTGSWSIKSTRHYGPLLTVQYGTSRMDAIEIISKTLNQAPIVVNKMKVSPKSKPLRDEKETLFAISKQNLLMEKFESWIRETPERRKTIETLYNLKYGFTVARKFDGSFLKMPDVNPAIHLFGYQKDAIARMILTPNTLLLHDTGLGKTYEMVGAAHEIRRMGLGKKMLFVVPNNVLYQWKKMYLELYPNSNLLVVDPKKFTPANRNNILNNIIYNDYDSILMAYSSFDMLQISPDIQKEAIIKETEDIKESYFNNESSTSIVKRSYSALVKGEFEKEIEKIGDRVPGKIYFDDLGIDRLFVDEAHNYKNVPIKGRVRALGINTTGSPKCQSMMDKVHYVQKTHNGGGVVFGTATPITNSISDLYNMQRYLQEGQLVVLNIQAFNSWIANFAELSQNFEIDVDTSSYRMASRYSKFHNLPELAALLANVADFHKADDASDLPIFNGYTDISLEMNPECKKYIQYISQRADAIRSRTPMVFKDASGNEKRDNMLLVTRDGRDAALDLRLVDKEAEYNKNCKINRCAKEVTRIYKETAEDRLTQLIFCDTATPSNSRFNVYAELKRLLVESGIPSEEIAFIQEANTERKKKTLFKAVNEGKIRVLLGSSYTLGTGVNVQKKLIAIHHLDVPWTPNLMKQILGRIVRPGNSNKEVFAYRYITKQSFDAYSWQLLETKQNFISKMLSNKVNERQADDVDDSVLSYAEVKALAIGNPLLKERVETNNELNRVCSLRFKQSERIGQLKEDIVFLETSIPKLGLEIKKAELDGEYLRNNVQIENFGESEANLDEASKKANIENRNALKRLIFSSILNNANAREESLITNYFGFNVIAPNYTASFTDKFVYLERVGKYKVNVGTSDSGVLVRLNNFLRNFDNYIEELKKKRLENKEQLRVSREEISNAINYDNQIRDLKTKLAVIDMRLGVEKEDK